MNIHPVLRAPTFAFLLALLAATSPALAGDGEWKEVISDRGVTVWEQGAADRPLPKLRAATTIDATPIEIAAVIQDVSGHPKWMYSCAEARTVKDEGDTRWVYNRTDAPWPVSDRSAVVKSSMKRTADGGLVMQFAAANDVTVEDSGTVRMTRLEGRWILSPVEGGRTRLEYTVDADPGGMLPSWLIRQTANDLPLNTLLNLRKRVAETRGNYQEWIDGPGAELAGGD